MLQVSLKERGQESDLEHDGRTAPQTSTVRSGHRTCAGKERGTLQVVRRTDSSAVGAKMRAGLSSCLPLDR